MDKTKITQRILTISSNVTEPLFEIIDELEKEIKRLDSIVVEKNESHLAIVNRYDNMSKETKQEMSTLRQLREIVGDEKKQLDRLKDNIDNNYEKLSQRSIFLSSRIVLLEEEILRLEKEKNSLQFFEDKKQKTEETINELQKEALTIRRQIENVKKEKGKVIFELDKNISDKQKEFEEQLKKVLPTFEELKEIRKELDIREVDLKLIESRYKKLYAEKGAGFKV